MHRALRLVVVFLILNTVSLPAHERYCCGLRTPPMAPCKNDNTSKFGLFSCNCSFLRLISVIKFFFFQFYIGKSSLDRLTSSNGPGRRAQFQARNHINHARKPFPHEHSVLQITSYEHSHRLSPACQYHLYRSPRA